MTYVLYISAVIFGLKYKKSKICTTYMYIVMCILAALCYTNLDYENYQNSYVRASSGILNYKYIGYSLLERVCVNAGLSWQQYRWMIYIVSFALIVCGVYMLSNKVNYILSFYMLFSWGMHVVTIKSLLANGLSLVAISMLVRLGIKTGNNSWRRYILPFSLSAIASTIHLSTIYYILVGVLYVLFKKKYKSAVIIVAAIGSITVFFGLQRQIIYFAAKIGLINDVTYFSHLINKSTRYGFILSFFQVILIVLSCLQRKQKPLCALNQQSDMQASISNIVSSCLLLLPFFVLSSQYSRLLDLYIIFAIAYNANAPFKSRISISDFFRLISYLGMLAYCVYSQIITYGRTLGMVLQYNYLS